MLAHVRSDVRQPFDLVAYNQRVRSGPCFVCALADGVPEYRAAHELIYTADFHGAHGRLHHVAFWVDTREECLRAADIWLDNDIYIEAAPSKHAVAQGFFLYGLEPGGNRVEVTTGGYFVYDPEQPTVVWTEAERAKGQAWGVKTVETFHTYGTPPVD